MIARRRCPVVEELLQAKPSVRAHNLTAQATAVVIVPVGTRGGGEFRARVEQTSLTPNILEVGIYRTCAVATEVLCVEGTDDNSEFGPGCLSTETGDPSVGVAFRTGCASRLTACWGW